MTDTPQHNPRLAVLRDFTRGDDLWRLYILEKLDAVDPLRQPPRRISGGGR